MAKEYKVEIYILWNYEPCVKGKLECMTDLSWCKREINEKGNVNDDDDDDDDDDNDNNDDNNNNKVV